MTDYDYEEKRNFVRMNIETQITYKVKGSDGQSHHGTSDNLSATGLSMKTDYALEEGCEIELVMNPSGDRLPPFVAEGSVLRVEADDSAPGQYQVSISLTKTS